MSSLKKFQKFERNLETALSQSNFISKKFRNFYHKNNFNRFEQNLYFEKYLGIHEKYCIRKFFDEILTKAR